MAPFQPPAIDYSLLKNRSCIVTGAASGLGEVTTIKFAENGAYVTIADMQVELGQALAKRLADEGKKVTFVQCDTTDYQSSVAAFKHAVNFSPTKTLDIAVLFAGTDGERKGLVDQVLQDAGPPSLDSDPALPKHRAIDVNLLGVYLSTYLALHYFRLPPANGKTQSYQKSLILVSSMMGYVDCPYNTGYGVSKYGVRGLFRSIRSQAHRLNVRVNNLAPGYILTPLTKKVHQIESPEEVSKATGYKLPWAPIEYVVDATCHCAVNESVDGELILFSVCSRLVLNAAGRTFAIMPSGFIDQDEDFESGYGGAKYAELMKQDGLTTITSLFPPAKK